MLPSSSGLARHFKQYGMRAPAAHAISYPRPAPPRPRPLSHCHPRPQPSSRRARARCMAASPSLARMSPKNTEVGPGKQGKIYHPSNTR